MQLAERFDAVRRMRERLQRRTYGRRVGEAGLQHQRSRGQRIGDVMRQCPPHVGGGGDHTLWSDQPVTLEAVVGASCAERARRPGQR